VTDGITLGASETAKMAKNMPTIVKGLKKMGYSHYGVETRKLFEMLDSPMFKALTLFVQSGWVFTREISDMISHDEATVAEFKNIGISIADYKIDEQLQNVGKANKLYVTKGTQAVLALVLEFVKDENHTPEIMTLLRTVAEYIPIVGSVVAQFNLADEIATRKNPREIAAYNEYMEVERAYAEEVRKVHEESLAVRLQKIVDFSYSSSPVTTAIGNF
jgi:hypothetical protein